MPQISQSGKQAFSPYFLLAFSLVLGAFLRIYHIGAQPFWLDEAYSYWFSSKPLSELWTVVPQYETHPPFYYTILKIWSLFGSSEAWLRSLSALASIGCIPLIFILGRFLGKPIAGEWIGAGAALLLSVSPVQIQYAQEARPYAALTFATTLTLCSFLWLMRHPEEAGKPVLGITGPGNGFTNQRAVPGFSAWMTAALAVAVTLWLHNTSILYLAALSLIFLAWSFRQAGHRRDLALNILIAAALVLLLWGPWLTFLAGQTRKVIAGFWLSKPTAQSVMNAVSWLLFGNSLPSTASVKGIFIISVFLLLTALAAAGFMNIRRRSGPFIAILILGSIVGPILLELAFTLTVKPIFMARTLLYVGVPFFLAVAAGVMMLRGPRMRILAFTVISLVFLKWTFSYYADYRKEPWDRIADMLDRQAKNDLVLLVPNHIEIPLSYYLKKSGENNFKTVCIPRPFPASSEITSADIRGIDNVVAGSSSPVWLITRMEDLYDRERSVFKLLHNGRQLISASDFQGITIYKFGRKNGEKEKEFVNAP